MGWTLQLGREKTAARCYRIGRRLRRCQDGKGAQVLTAVYAQPSGRAQPFDLGPLRVGGRRIQSLMETL